MSPETLLYKEADRAFFHALLLYDQVHIPAVSFFEMPMCRQILRHYEPLFTDGWIYIIGDGDSLPTFFERRIGEYAKSSAQYRLYKRLQRGGFVAPPFIGVQSDTTAGLIERWPRRFTDDDGQPRQVFARESLRREWKEIIVGIGDRLNGQAFITKNVAPLLFERRDKQAKWLLMESINNVLIINEYEYFGNMYYCRRGGPTLRTLAVDYEALRVNLKPLGLYDQWKKQQTYVNFLSLRRREDVASLRMSIGIS